MINWRSHADTNLEFRKGTNLIVGIMGAGKSSILEGISFAFFGTFPSLEHRKLKHEDIIRLNESRATVILRFELDGIEYRIERTLELSKRGISSSAELYLGGGMVEQGSTAVTKFITNLLSLDYDLFTRAIYSDQNNIDHFFNLDPKRRKEEVDTLLGLDRFGAARTNIVTVINRVRSKSEFIGTKFSKEKLEELRVKEKSQSEAIIASESMVSTLSSKILGAAKELELAQATFKFLNGEKESFERLEKEIVKLSAQYDAVRKELEGSEPIDDQSLDEMKKQLSVQVEIKGKLTIAMRSCEDRFSAVFREIGSIDARLKNLSEAKIRLEAAKAEVSDLQRGSSMAQLQEIQKEAEQSILAMESERKSIAHEIAELDALIVTLRPGLSECPLCSSKLTEDGVFHLKGEKDAAIESKKKRARELDCLLPAKKKDGELLLARIRKASMASERIAILEKELNSSAQFPEVKARRESDAAKLKEERQGLQKTSDSVSESIDKMRIRLVSAERILARGKELAVIGKNLEESKTKFASLRFDQQSFENARLVQERLHLDSERLLSEKKAVETQLRMSREMLSLVRSELSTLLSFEKEIKELTSLEEQLSVYKNALLETQTHLRSTLTDAINSAMNEIWPIFYPYKNYSTLRLAVSEKDYVFEVYDNGQWKALETVASGGERACAALTLRTALAMVLTPKLSWLILDEPTHNLDSIAVELLSSALEQKVPEIVAQTFVITHDEAFMGSEFASSYRLLRDKERNGETKIEKI